MLPLSLSRVLWMSTIVVPSPKTLAVPCTSSGDFLNLDKRTVVSSSGPFIPNEAILKKCESDEEIMRKHR